MLLLFIIGKFGNKKNIFQIISFIFLNCLFITTSQAQENFAQEIEQLIKANLPNVVIGLVLQDADSGKILYEKSGHTLFTPASTTKLFTAAAALYELTPQFKFATKIKYNKAQLNNHILKGAAVIEFSGDPSFTLNDLNNLIKTFKKYNITEIQGDLILDDSCFKGQVIGNGWSNNDIPWYYASPISGIIINENQINVSITSAKKPGDLATVKFTGLNSQYFTLKSMVKTVAPRENDSMCELQTTLDNSNNIFLSGCWPIGNETTKLKFATQNSRKLAYDFIKDVLLKEKLKLTGNIIFKKSTENLHTLTIHYSLPLQKLLPKILAESNNIYTEALTKTLGAKLYNHGSFKAGASAIKNILQKPTGINFDTLNLTDGSGLSRYNLITPRQFARLLFVMYHTPKLKKYYLQALAVAGKKGTLQTRLASFDTNANIKAKTGSLSGVSGIVGYAKTSSNKNLIFSLLINNTLLPLTSLKNIEDQFCQLIVNY